MEAKQICEEVIMPKMPKGAEIRYTRLDYGHVANISWLLGDDTDRPHKRSKTIAVIFEFEVIEDLSDMPDNLLHGALKVIGDYTEDFLNNFDPKHNAQRWQANPVEEFRVVI